MSIGERTIRCPICGKPYVTYPFYAGDQSACPTCRGIARSGENGTKETARPWPIRIKTIGSIHR